MQSLMQITRAGAGDDEFLYRVYASTRADEFAALGLPESMLESLLRMQFEAQRHSYALQYPTAEQRIVRVGGEKAGYWITHDGADALRLVYVALLPECRNRGTGTALIRRLQRQAFERDKPLRLQVSDNSPARRLYQRLGFSETGFEPPYVAMEWFPDNEG